MARRKAETTTAPETSQAKRGPKPKPKDASARARSVQESRRALAERGGRLLQLRLEPEAAAALDEIQARTGGTLAEAVSIALLDAKYVLDLHVRLTATEAEALATVRESARAKSDRDAIGTALRDVAWRVRGGKKIEVATPPATF
jgi:hypothetical protein